MNQERYEQASNLLSQHLKENSTMGGLIGVSFDPTSKENNGLSLSGLNRDSETVKKLESLGFKVIYPAKLTEREVARMNTENKYVYDAKMSNALVIDGNEQNLSLDFAQTIARHYFSTGYSMERGVDIKNNSVTEYSYGNFVEGTNNDFQDLLNDLGFQTEMNEYGNVTVSSNIPYPAVKKSKFEQIYNKAKGKIQGAFAKLKSIVTSKDQVKENDTNERE